MCSCALGIFSTPQSQLIRPHHDIIHFWDGKKIALAWTGRGALIAAGIIAFIFFSSPVGTGIVGGVLLGTAVVLGVGGVVTILALYFLKKHTNTQSEKHYALCRHAAKALTAAASMISDNFLNTPGLFSTTSDVDITPEMRYSLLQNPANAVAHLNARAKAHTLATFIKLLFTNHPLSRSSHTSPLMTFFDAHSASVSNENRWALYTTDLTDERYKKEDTQMVRTIAGSINPYYFNRICSFIRLLRQVGKNEVQTQMSTKRLAQEIFNPILQRTFDDKLTNEQKANTALAEFIITHIEDIEKAKPASNNISI